MRQVMATLRDLARDGRTVVASIHQPRSSIFAMFDDLVLLSEGAALYAGPADGALEFFAEQGHACPEHYNPAEFLADLISVDPTSAEAEASTRCVCLRAHHRWAAEGLRGEVLGWSFLHIESQAVSREAVMVRSAVRVREAVLWQSRGGAHAESVRRRCAVPVRPLGGWAAEAKLPNLD